MSTHNSQTPDSLASTSLYHWDSELTAARATSLHGLVEETVARSGTSIAARCADDALTYDELSRCSNQLAHYLHAQGLKPGDLVGLYVDRSTGSRVASGAGTAPIGSPVENTEIRILDDDLKPSAIVDPGELYIGGHGLARGYLNPPEPTAERFILHPLDKEYSGNRLYRTPRCLNTSPSL